MSDATVYNGVGRVEWFDGLFVSMRKELQISLTTPAAEFDYGDRAVLRISDGPTDEFSVFVPSAAVLRKIGEVATAMADQLDKQKAYKRLIEMEECS